MVKKNSASSARGKRTKKNASFIRDNKIDYSDIPALSDAELKKMKRVGIPLLGDAARLLVAIRLDPVVLDKLRKLAEDAGKGYQTLINQILAQYINKKTA